MYKHNITIIYSCQVIYIKNSNKIVYSFFVLQKDTYRNLDVIVEVVEIKCFRKIEGK